MRSLLTISAAVLLASFTSAENADQSRYHPRPYKINVSRNLIRETRQKASRFRPSIDISAPDWFDGPPSANVSQIARYLATDYDWFEYQHEINTKFSHYITTVPSPGTYYPHDLDLHFIHQKSKRKDAIPIILLHGWPSTSLEWEKVILDLANPKDDSQPAFHVVAPDLPGFGFSPAPVAPNLGGNGHAAIVASLMQQLGYQAYAVYSTDLGFPIGLEIVQAYEEKVLNHISDFYIALPNSTDMQRYQQNLTTPEESAYISSTNGFFDTHSAYGSLHSTLPLSVAHALNDSPVGFLAWMWQLDFTVRDLSVPYSMRELVSQAMTLFIPGVYGNIRSYKELYPLILKGPKKSRVPTSILQWGYPKPGYSGLDSFNFVVSLASYLFFLLE